MNLQKDVVQRFHALKGFGLFWCLIALFSLCAASFPGKEAFATDTCASVTDTIVSNQKPVDEAAKLKIQENYGKIPLYFVRNNGQMNEQVRFYEKGSGRSTFFTDRGIYLSLTGGRQSKDKSREMASNQLAVDSTPAASTENPQPEVVRLIPLGANKHPEIVAEDLQECKVNYFHGNDPEKWKTNIPTYQSVVYKDVYKDINMKFYGNNRQMEYDIIVNPGASPSRVQLAYEGVADVQINDNGELEILLNSPLKRGDNSYCPPPAGVKGVDGENTSDEDPLGFSLESSKIIQKKPYVYQIIDGKKVEREGRFVIRDRRPSSVKGTRYTGTNNGHGQRCIYGFQVAAYDKRYPLVIDPPIAYSTYLGGSSYDHGSGIAVDSAGNAYVTGNTSSSDFPLSNAIYGSKKGNADVFVTKIAASGTSLSYSTYLGGGGYSDGSGIAVDSAGNAYVTGGTSSTDFPLSNAIYGSYRGGLSDAFVTKIAASGTSLSYSTYLGGSDSDVGQGIAVDSSGNAYVTGGAQVLLISRCQKPSMEAIRVMRMSL